MKARALFSCLCSLTVLGSSLVGTPASAQVLTSVPATAETEPVAAAGDVAIRVDPVDPAASLVIGADRRTGLDVYDLGGNRTQHLERPGRANGVDLRSGFPLGGRVVDLVAIGGRGVGFFAVDATSRRLDEVGARAFPGPFAEEGICLYRSDLSERFYAFTTEPDGVVTQWELVDRAGLVDIRAVRRFDAGSAVDGCVADDELGRLYVSEKEAGIWEYGAEPEAWPALRTSVDRVGSGHLTAGVGGLAIVRQPGRRGYLLASSVGDSSFAVYRRQTHAFVGRVQVVAGATADGCSASQGIEAVAASLGRAFPFGIFVCGDADNTAPGSTGGQNFKYVRLERVLR
jgi:3-phytase